MIQGLVEKQILDSFFIQLLTHNSDIAIGTRKWKTITETLFNFDFSSDDDAGHTSLLLIFLSLRRESKYHYSSSSNV